MNNLKKYFSVLAFMFAVSIVFATQQNNTENLSSTFERYEEQPTIPCAFTVRECTNNGIELCAVQTGRLRTWPSCSADFELVYIFRTY